MPRQHWRQAKRCQKNTDVRRPQKRNQNFYGDKNHVEADVKHKIIRDYEVTDASVHDSNVFESILDETNTSKDVYADIAYRSEKHETKLKEAGFRPHLQRKGCRGRQLTEWEKQGNRTRSKVRSRIEHVFGAMRQRAGDVILRTIRLASQSESKTRISEYRLQHREIFLFEWSKPHKMEKQRQKYKKSR